MAPPGPGPQPTDADDSIVLADLVRTGEASRLRRRGAMRLDHGPGGPAVGRPPPAAGTVNARPSSYAPPARPIVIEPSRTPSPELGADAGLEEYPYSGGVYRQWDGAAPAGRVQGRGAESVQAVEIISESAETGQAYVLYCGGEDFVGVEEEPPRRFEPSLFPQVRTSTPSPSSSRPQKAARRTNGCGAVVHVRAYHQRPRGVWMAKEEASETVVPMDPAYCDHPAMDKMLKSACGCIREGIGCSMCGNTLGTRYVPCQAASESIFAPSPTSSSAPSSSRSHRPSGPSYWNARSTLSHRRCSSRGSALSYYTFFADRVSASPNRDVRPQETAPHTAAEPRRGGSSRAASPEIDYGLPWTASPQPVSTPLPMSGPGTAPSNPQPPSPVFALPPLPPITRNSAQLRLPSSAVRLETRIGLGLELPLVMNTPAGDTRLNLDPDGVPLDEMGEPGSPDKEGMSWPGR